MGKILLLVALVAVAVVVFRMAQHRRTSGHATTDAHAVAHARAAKLAADQAVIHRQGGQGAGQGGVGGGMGP